MRTQTLIVLALSLICGLAAAVGVQALRKQPVVPVVETIPVVFAVRDVRRGETIEAAMVEVRKIPKDQAPPGALPSTSDVVSRTSAIPMLRGDVVADAKLLPKGSGAGMAALIRPGMRAFTIQTPSFSSSLAGFLLPGNRVDVLLTTVPPGGSDGESGGAMTTTLLQNVEILAVHTTVDTPAANKIDPNEARSVTLLVTPDQAALLDLGQNKGTLHLSLRNLKDDENTKTKAVTLAELGLSRPAQPTLEPVAQPLPPEPADPLPETRAGINGSEFADPYASRDQGGHRSADHPALRSCAGDPTCAERDVEGESCRSGAVGFARSAWMRIESAMKDGRHKRSSSSRSRFLQVDVCF